MCPLFSDDDRGKPVENDAGETVGTIETVDGDVAYVRPKPGAVDSIKSSVGWESRTDETLALDGNDVTEITDERVRIAGPLVEQLEDDTADSTADTDTPRTEPTGGTSGVDETDVSEATTDEDAAPMQETNRDRGIEADPSELTDDASEFEVQPEDIADDSQRSDAEVTPDDERRRTDAEVEPTSDERDDEQ